MVIIKNYRVPCEGRSKYKDTTYANAANYRKLTSEISRTAADTKASIRVLTREVNSRSDSDE